MLYRSRLPLLCLLLLLQNCSPITNFGSDSASTAVSVNYDLLSPCEKTDNAMVAAIVSESLCGKISVFEDRATQTGRKIELNVMLLPAITSATKPDPIVLLAGGPGQAAVDAGPLLFYQLANLRKERDVLLVDQRGTGDSNSLACDLDDEGFEQLAMPIDKVNALQLKRMKECLTEYSADPALYTTPIAMDDLNEVRQRLGYDKINLLGISYGTRAGLIYIRRHGDTVRSAVLDAVAPLSMIIPEHVAEDAQAAFNKVLTDCKKQPGCQQTYPNLAEHFDELMNRLRETPETVTLQHPRTGAKIKALIEAGKISSIIHSTLYNRLLSRLLPLAIEEAYQGNYQPLFSTSYAISGDDAGISIGMMASVLCAADMKRLPGAANSRYFENTVFETLAPICKFWPTGDLPADYYQPVTSDVPILLTSGTLDPITPPKYAMQAVANLANAEHIVVSGVGHGTITTGCMPKIVQQFYDDPDPGVLKSGCSANLKRPPFFTSFAGAVSPADLQVPSGKQATND